MKINNKLFLITATLGLMAAGSVTAFAGPGHHANFVYVTNDTPQAVTVTEKWIGNHTDLYLESNVNYHKCSQLVETIPADTTGGAFEQDADTCAGSNIGHSGIGQFTFSNTDATVNVEYHAFWGADVNSSVLTFNHLNWGKISNNVYAQSQEITLKNTSGTTVTTNNQELDCTDHTNMYIMIGTGVGTKSPTSSPLALLRKLF